MRILFLGNNYVGLSILRWLKAQGDTIVGVILHPPERRRYGDELDAEARDGGIPIIDGSQLHDSDTLRRIEMLRPDIGVSIYFGYILRQSFLELFPLGCINLHPAFLPYNRGSNPNVWSIIDETPAGATLHYVDSHVDTGDIIAQRQVTVEPIDTGESLYSKLETACIDVFTETWPQLRAGQAPRLAQPNNIGSTHRQRDLARLDHIDLDRQYTGRELLNLLRARTFPPYQGCFFMANGRRVYIRIQLNYEDQLPPQFGESMSGGQ